jgi:hypothetical protein
MKPDYAQNETFLEPRQPGPAARSQRTSSKAAGSTACLKLEHISLTTTVKKKIHFQTRIA